MEGTNVVLEGNHLLPEFLSDVPQQAFVIIQGSAAHIRERVHGPTHAYRRVTPSDEQRILDLLEFIVKQARAYRLPVVDNNDVEAVVDQILATH